jgi:NAD(P)-dependent dehydrogenase (short-subunit alcohol dehydrogenase family)
MSSNPLKRPHSEIMDDDKPSPAAPKEAQAQAQEQSKSQQQQQQHHQPFAGKVFAITGGARGIGLATAKHLLARGCTSLSLADRLRPELGTTSQELLQTYPQATIITFDLDVTDAAAVVHWLADVTSKFGGLDGAVNCAGTVGRMQPIRQMPEHEWNNVIGVNLTGVFNCVRAEMVCMKDGGSIVNVASVGGKIGWEGGAAYCASKHGVIGLTKVAAKELGPQRVRVNAVCP